MSAHNKLTVHLDPLLEEPQTPLADNPDVGNCEINVQVADGWAITGHYQNNTLQTISLQKTSQSGKI